MNKDRLFQYGVIKSGGIIEMIKDTGLITEKEANKLWDKYLPQVKQNFKDGHIPHLCIWMNAKNTVNYHEAEKEIDGNDCIVQNNKVYKYLMDL